jgi:hypothetical protein
LCQFNVWQMSECVRSSTANCAKSPKKTLQPPLPVVLSVGGRKEEEDGREQAVNQAKFILRFSPGQAAAAAAAVVAAAAAVVAAAAAAVRTELQSTQTAYGRVQVYS